MTAGSNAFKKSPFDPIDGANKAIVRPYPVNIPDVILPALSASDFSYPDAYPGIVFTTLFLFVGPISTRISLFPGSDLRCSYFCGVLSTGKSSKPSTKIISTYTREKTTKKRPNKLLSEILEHLPTLLSLIQLLLNQTL